MVVAGVRGQAPGASKLTPNLADDIERPLRYTPDGGDFVVVNGPEFFNRPLYGGHTAFRVDGGDRPEFVLYLPGRGGNLRLGLRTAAGAKWLHDAATVEARYRPGGLLHTVRDPWLGPGELRLAAYAPATTEGLILRVEAHGIPAGVELLWAYGGVNGQRGRRDGDIGTEPVPISEWFQLRPEFCAGNEIELREDGFALRAALPRGKSALLRGVVPTGARQIVADAATWSDGAALSSAFGPPLVGGPDRAGAAPVASPARPPAPARPVVLGCVALTNGHPLHLAVQRADPDASAAELDTYRAVTTGRAEEKSPLAAKAPVALTPAALPAAFAAAETHFAALRRQLGVETPDPFLNAAVAALNVAADAVWDEPQGAVMHGAIAWRSKLLGWRGPYAMDALGWHDRARRHLAYWATRQNTGPIPEKLPPPDADANLARSEAALHTNGDISASHYDMNLVYIDALLRHLLWTGDLDFARAVWPVIERHLAWERRSFRREFDVRGGKLPLYEAYAAIWASDDLQYHGGGTAHASAYNYWHNLHAARLARLLGVQPAFDYQREADLIARGVRELLWTGTHFAEFKDYLGRQLVHPSAALWTFYHLMDAELPTRAEASSMTRRLPPSLPVRGPGVPTDDTYAVHASTDWMPYTWSLNNVVMGENLHTALGLWQAGRADDAFRLTKSALLASMFMGICPGNVGSMNYLDVHRRESQRDFADGGGVMARAVVEGLFGVRPDALAGELVVAPGWPAAWPQARLAHPRVSLDFRRDGAVDRYDIVPRFGRAMAVRLALPRRGERAEVVVNGRPVEVKLDAATGRLTALLAPAERQTVEVRWHGSAPGPVGEETLALVDHPVVERNLPLRPGQPADPIDLTPHFNDRVTEIFQPGKYLSPRSPFVSLALPAQGIGAWAGHVNATAEIDDTGLRAVAAAQGGRLTLPTGVFFATPGPGAAPNILFVSQWDNYPREASVPLSGRARVVHLLMAGSTNAMQSRLDNGEVIVTYADGSTARLALRNPETWWPIEQDYFIDDFQFRVGGSRLTRVDLKTGRVRELDLAEFKGRGRTVPGGAATVLQLDLDPDKELRSLTVRALANEVVIGLMAATLAR